MVGCFEFDSSFLGCLLVSLCGFLGVEVDHHAAKAFFELAGGEPSGDIDDLAGDDSRLIDRQVCGATDDGGGAGVVDVAGFERFEHHRDPVSE